MVKNNLTEDNVTEKDKDNIAEKGKKKKERVKKNIFEQYEEQKKKLLKLTEKKEKEIKNTVIKTFVYLMEEENFIKLQNKLLEDKNFEETLKNLILTELNKTKEKKGTEIKEVEKNEY